nr:hypothetical protein [Tanacetum cinerariifolium]
MLSLQTQLQETAELVVRFADEKYFVSKENESLKDDIKSLQTENNVLKSGESELSKKIDQMKSQVSELLKKLQISNQEMKQQIIFFEEGKRMFLAKNEFMEKVFYLVQKEYNDLLESNDVLKQRLETKFMFLKHEHSLKKMFEIIEQEYESNVSKISITNSTIETKNLELVKEMGDKVKHFDDEKKVFGNKMSKLEKDLTQRVKDFDDVKTELSRRTDKFEIAHVEDIVEFETAIAQTFMYLRQFLLLLFNSSANFWQWHLFSSGSGNNLHWQWELILPVGTLTWQ